MRLDFQADSARLSAGLFEHMSEVAGEIWFKAALRWQAATCLPLRFDSAAGAIPPQSKEPRFYHGHSEERGRRLGSARPSPVGASVFAEAAIAGQPFSHPIPTGSVLDKVNDFAPVQLQL